MGSAEVAELLIQDLSTDPPREDTIVLHANETIKIGRDEDNNDYNIVDPAVSRNHLEFYCIKFDDDSGHYPMVYVRDRQSNNGTWVNDTLIGNSEHISRARLLEDGDKVIIKPNLVFHVYQPSAQMVKLSHIQLKETRAFDHRFVVTDRTLGDGGSARVHLAYDAKTGEQLVCKVHDLCRMRAHGKKDMVRRLGDAAVVATQVEHPNVASFRHAFRSRYTLYVFEELATGGDLFSLLMRYESFKEIEVRWITRQVMMAVKYMHEKGIAHRDLKLENILCAICPRPEHRIVITDFGHVGVETRGRMQSEVGTPGWQAPELFFKRKWHGVAVDIWSIGVLVAQLLSGCETIDAMTTLQKMASCGSKDGEMMGFIRNIIRDIEESRQKPLCEAGKDFLRRCLTIDSRKRMTAAQALQHPWLTEPKEDLGLFLQRERETTEHWSRRKVFTSLLNELPDVLGGKSKGKKVPKRKREEEEDEYDSGDSDAERPASPFIPQTIAGRMISKYAKKRARIPNVSMLPAYVGLEKHLKPELSSKRKAERDERKLQLVVGLNKARLQERQKVENI